MSVLIEVKNLTKLFGTMRAVDNISFSVRRGEVMGFLGPNAAGKSTTMKMITGFLTPADGKIRVCGHDIEEKPIDVKKAIGYLPEGAPSYSEMTPKSFLTFIAEVRGYGKKERSHRVDQALKKANLQSVTNQPIETLSKGFKRRVGIAQAIIHDPEVLIMDEPTDGLDPNQKHEVRLLIAEMAKNKAIIISTHILEEVQAVCSRAIIIAQGKLLFDGTPSQLEALSEYHNAVNLTLSTELSKDVEKLLNSIPDVKQVRKLSSQEDRSRFVIHPNKGQSIINSVSQFVRQQQWAIDELSVEKGRLDEVFRDITSQNKGISQEVLT